MGEYPVRHVLSPLPFPLDALEPAISEETVDYHYNKHHRGYVDKLNKAVAGTSWEKHDLNFLVKKSLSGDIFNYAGQVWNHNFYWECMDKPNKTKKRVLLRIENDLAKFFGSMDEFKSMFRDNVVNHFGSGWVWLMVRPASCISYMFKTDEKYIFQVESSQDAAHPGAWNLVDGFPILVCDVWEHAYYIDHRNEKEKYFDTWWSCVDMLKLEQRYNAALDKI